VFNSSASYWPAIGTSLSNSPAISHGFPSQTEARIYLAGADLVLVSDALEPYVLTFRPDGDLDGTGVLLAAPSEAIPQELPPMVSSVHLQRHQCREWYWTMALWQ